MAGKNSGGEHPPNKANQVGQNSQEFNVSNETTGTAYPTPNCDFAPGKSLS